MILTLAMPANAQVNGSSHKNKNSSGAATQADEQLAREFYNNKDYGKAKELYLSLYRTNYNSYNFSMYIECLIRLSEYDEAIAAMKSYLRKHPDEWKVNVDLGYMYKLQGDNDKADKHFRKIIKDVSDARNSIVAVANLFRSRNLNEYALALYEKGAANPNNDSHFYLEKAYAYNSMLDFANATDCYLNYLEETPEQYEMIKTRIRFMFYYDIDGSVADIIRTALLAKAQANPENEQFAELLVWFSLQTEDYDIALTFELALDRRKGDRENDILYLADIAADNKRYEIAISAYKYVTAKGEAGVYFIKAQTSLFKIEYEKALAEQIDDKKYYEKLSNDIGAFVAKMGLFEETAALAAVRADILAFRLESPDEAKSLLNTALESSLNNTLKSELKMELADIYLFTDEMWEATLLYSQIDKSMKDAPIGHEARFKNARLRYFMGEFEWALAALNVLKAATSKLIANDAMTLSLLINDNLEYDTIGLRRLAKADYYIYQKKFQLAEIMLDSVNMYNPNEVSMPYLLYRKADIALELKNYELADSLLTRIYEGYADSYLADKALMDKAEMLENQSKDLDGAMECYGKLVDEYTASVYVAQARKSYRRLRNDFK